jgi:hypothetical protein
MEQAGYLRGPKFVADLSKVSDVIRDMEMRQSFKQDPIATLERADCDVSQLSRNVIDTLSAMSDQELDAVIRFHDALCEANYIVEAELGDGRVCFF